MDAEQIFLTEESTANLVQAEEPKWQINTDLSNIISLAEQGLLHSPQPTDRIEDDFTYDNYSPLNEW